MQALYSNHCNGESCHVNTSSISQHLSKHSCCHHFLSVPRTLCGETESSCDQDVSYMADHSQSLNLRENNAWKFFTFHNKTWYPLSYWPFSTLLSLAFIIPGTLFANEHGFIDTERRWKGMRRLAERNIIWRNIVISSGDSMCVWIEREFIW